MTTTSPAEELLDESAFLRDIAERIQGVRGVVGVVLGGSRALGTNTPESDFDLGILYRDAEAFDIAGLERVARELDDEHRSELVTPIGGWGPWIIGGGWLKIQKHAVDFIYRDIGRVAGVIDDCRQGKVAIHYQPAYTVGYVSTTYMAEVDACRPLWDPNGEIAALKALTRPYPEALRQAMLGTFGWMPPFAVTGGRKCAARADVTFASSCAYWAVAALGQMLLALNGEYCLNDKAAVLRIDALAQHPRDFRERVERVFTLLAPSRAAIEAAFDELASVVAEAESLVSLAKAAG